MCEQVLMVFVELVQRLNLIRVAEGNFDILSPRKNIESSKLSS